jgi:hypothetical protein
LKKIASNKDTQVITSLSQIEEDDVKAEIESKVKSEIYGLVKSSNALVLVKFGKKDKSEIISAHLLIGQSYHDEAVKKSLKETRRINVLNK